MVKGEYNEKEKEKGLAWNVIDPWLLKNVWERGRERERQKEREGGKEKKKRQKRGKEEKRGGIDKKIKERSEFYAELIWISSSGSFDFKN